MTTVSEPHSILIAPDSFKECLPAWEVAEAIARGWRRVYPEDALICLPMADGGEGTVEAFVRATGGTRSTSTVTGPLGTPVEAVWGVLGDGTTAIIEMAAASGLHLVPLDQRDPRMTTSRGTGELIAAALDAGCRRILVGLGGSATNDGGAGMVSALGYRFMDADGQPLEDGGGALAHLAAIDDSGVHPRLVATEIIALCDVTNPLLGEHGATAIYGPQKGTTPAIAAELEAALNHFADITENFAGHSARDTPGSGAAGGLGFGMRVFAHATLSPGLEQLAEACGLDALLEHADLIITGEGRLDEQTASGKLCMRVANRSMKHGVPCVALVGALQGEVRSLHKEGLTAAFSITPRPMPLEEAMAKTAEHLEAAGENLARLWHAARKS